MLTDDKLNSARVELLVKSAEGAPEIDINTEGELLTKLSDLKRAAATNATQRRQYADSPQLFMQSELSLDDAVRALGPVAVEPSLYGSLIRNGGLAIISDLLRHDNEDIVYHVFSLIHDLAIVDGDSDASEGHSELYAALVNEGVAARLFDTLSTRLIPRLESRESDDRDSAMEAAAQTFAVFENMLDARPDLAASLVKNSSILEVCITQLQGTSPDSTAVELLAVLLQDSVECKVAFAKKNGIDALLQALAPFRKKSRSARTIRENDYDATASDNSKAESKAEQSEMIQNMFGVLCSALLAGEIAKASFVTLEGIELMVSFMKMSSEYRTAATKVLDFACTGHAPAVGRLMRCGGLGVLCAVLQGIGDDGHSKRGRKRKRESSEDEIKALTEHTLGLMFCIFRYGDEADKKRLLRKFWEDDGAKTRKVLLLYKHFARAIEDVTGEKGQYLLDEKGRQQARADRNDDEENLLERLDAGLFIVQLGAAIITSVVTNSERDFQLAVTRFLPQLALSREIIATALRQYAESIESGDSKINSQETEAERQRLLALAAEMMSLPQR